jgi:glycosyltransferase involved in cell wall biosynthesis
MLEALDRVVVVDDGCTDGCIDTVRDLPLRIESFSVNRGKGHSLIAGIRAALAMPETEAVCLLDADGQHDPAEIPKLHAALRRTEADLVIGARTFAGREVPLRSRFGNRVTVAVTALLLGVRLPDTQCGFRLLSRRFADYVVENIPGGRYETEMDMLVRAVREGFRVESVPIATVYEPDNRSSHFRKISDSMRIYARLLRALTARRTSLRKD